MKFEKSKAKNKKYAIKTPSGNIVNFGDKRYEHYKDTTPLKLYSKLDHNDKDRQKSYCKRSAGIKDKKGNLTKNDKYSPNALSRKYLWSC
tara:strand:- start:20 stop:289 length:270 start_codon:yes stop_codon:yes gene_type:complete